MPHALTVHRPAHTLCVLVCRRYGCSLTLHVLCSESEEGAAQAEARLEALTEALRVARSGTHPEGWTGPSPQQDMHQSQVISCFVGVLCCTIVHSTPFLRRSSNLHSLGIGGHSSQTNLNRVILTKHQQQQIRHESCVNESLQRLL